MSPGSRTRDFTVIGRYNYRYAVKAFVKLDESLHGVTVVVPTNDREIPGSIPGKYNLQIKFTSVNSLGTPRSTERPDHICTTIQSDGVTQWGEQICTTIESDEIGRASCRERV